MFDIFSLFFGLFAFLAILASIGVILSKKAIHAVLCLVFLFFNISCLFLLIKAEFIAMLMLVVYVGAVTVLFLFFVMTIADAEKSAKLCENRYLKSSLLIFLAFLACFLPAMIHKTFAAAEISAHPTIMIGELLYTQFAPIFQSCGVVLLVAIMASITLMNQNKEPEEHPVKKQNFLEQMSASAKKNLKLVNVDFKAGMNDE